MKKFALIPYNIYLQTTQNRANTTNSANIVETESDNKSNEDSKIENGSVDRNRLKLLNHHNLNQSYKNSLDRDDPVLNQGHNERNVELIQKHQAGRGNLMLPPPEGSVLPIEKSSGPHIKTNINLKNLEAVREQSAQDQSATPKIREINTDDEIITAPDTEIISRNKKRKKHKKKGLLHKDRTSVIRSPNAAGKEQVKDKISGEKDHTVTVRTRSGRVSKVKRDPNSVYWLD